MSHEETAPTSERWKRTFPLLDGHAFHKVLDKEFGAVWSRLVSLMWAPSLLS